MYRGNYQRPAAGASQPGYPPTGYNVNIALSRANNEVHVLKRHVAELNANLIRKHLVYEKMVCEQKTKLSDLIMENEGLSLKLTETTKQLVFKNAELDNQRQSLGSKVTWLLSTNGSLQEELHNQLAENHQLVAEHKLLKIETEAMAKTIRENEGLSLKLTETTEQLSVKSAELTVNNQTWQQKYDKLEEKTFKELDNQRQSFESKVTGLLSTNGTLKRKLHKQLAENHQLEAEHKLLKIETEALAKTITENEGLSLKLTETTEQLSVKSAELTVNNQTWQQKYDQLEEKTFKELDNQRQSLETKVTELLSTNGCIQEELHKVLAENHQLGAENKLLKIKTETLQKSQDEISSLSDLSESCLTLKIRLMEDTIANGNQILSSKIQDLQAENHQLGAENKLLKVKTETLQKSQDEISSLGDLSESCLTLKIRLMEDTIANGNKILISKIQDLQDDKTVLENICLYLKKKSRGIFGRRMQDRQTEIDKMRRKMQDRETKN